MKQPNSMIIENSMEQEISDQFHREISAYHELLGQARDIPNFSRVGEYALAFIVEDMCQKAGEQLEHNLNALKENLRQAKETDGLQGLAWTLAQEVYKYYDAFLARLENQEQNPVRQENLKALREGLARDIQLSEVIYQSREVAPIGGIILEH